MDHWSMLQMVQQVMKLDVDEQIRVVWSDEIPEAGRKLLRVLDVGAEIREWALELVRRAPEFEWIMGSIEQDRSDEYPGLAPDIEGAFCRHPLRGDRVLAGVVRRLCELLRRATDSAGQGQSIDVEIVEEALGRDYGGRRAVVLHPRVIGPTARELGVSEAALADVVL